ncbi:MAG: aspartate/glutamate racemase family protein [Chloroflexota bacterium]|nr:aspartate/glutamate racemase family protein [Chloroflexota bacterium]
MKTIGVLGGLGPQATMDFEQRLHALAQQLIPQRDNTGYPGLIVAYVRRPPVVMDATGRPLMPFQLEPQLLAAARQLGQMADFLVITSNGVHRLQGAIEAVAGRPILSMIEVTVAEVVHRGWRHVGVIGFMGPHAYSQPLEQQGIRWTTVSAELQAGLDAVVPAVAEGRNDAQTLQAVRQAVAALRAQGVDGIILGCTEFPLVLHADLDVPDLLNPAALLAEAAVRHAMA